ncbi:MULTISPECIES: hypothetical protein [unclassified Rickettsia]|uniref:hypothetical protein n=1 Tax=unclassified Rickettsia TaxID=114295 RepID=UPI00313346FC
MARIFDVIPVKTGIQKNTIISHPEFISGSTIRDAQNLFSMTKAKKAGFPFSRE